MNGTVSEKPVQNPFRSQAVARAIPATANTDQQRAIAEVQAALAIHRDGAKLAEAIGDDLPYDQVAGMLADMARGLPVADVVAMAKSIALKRAVDYAYWTNQARYSELSLSDLPNIVSKLARKVGQ